MEMTDMMDDSLDGGPPSVGSGEMMGTTMSMGIISAPVSAKKVGTLSLGLISDHFHRNTALVINNTSFIYF